MTIGLLSEAVHRYRWCRSAGVSREISARHARAGYAYDKARKERKAAMGLVERCEEWVKALNFYTTTYDGSPEMVAAVAVEMKVELKRLLAEHDAAAEIDRLKRVIRGAHNDLNDPANLETVKIALSNAILFPPVSRQ